MLPDEKMTAGRSGSVVTVTGAVAPEDLGVTLAHEHLFANLTPYWAGAARRHELKETESLGLANLGETREYPFINRYNCILSDIDVAVAEAKRFRDLGGKTIVDVTLAEIGRDVVALERVARSTGLNVIAGCGHYIHLTHSESLADAPVEIIAAQLIRELTEGIDDTGIRAGIIGEIGTSDPLHPREEKVLRAAAKAQAATGAAISVHLHPTAQLGHEVLSILESEGANPTRVVLGHLDLSFGASDFATALAYHRSLASRGCIVEYDTCGKAPAYMRRSSYSGAFWIPSDRERVEGVVRLVEDGFQEQILLSQDVCFKYELTAYGGFGYSHILENFCFYLEDYGLAEHDIRGLLVDNPRRLLTLDT